MLTPRPDIILLVLDTQRADRLSCYGYPTETSPNLDALASRATLFKQAVAPAQWTVPTHASIFTGLYPTQHGVHQMESILPHTIPTLAEKLQQVGYFTAGYSHNPLIGKIKNGLTRGFYQFANYQHLSAGLLEHQLSPSYGQVNLAAKFKRRIRFLFAEVLGYSELSVIHHMAPLMSPFWSTARKITVGNKSSSIRKSLASAATLLIERRELERDQPIFAFINLMGTHIPYEPANWATQQFIIPRLGRKSAQFFLRQANIWQVDIRNWLELDDFDGESRAILDACYDAEVASQDAEVGIFIDRLSAAGVLDNTLLIVVADHGDHLGDKQRLNHAFGVYNALTRVPLLIKDPSNKFAGGAEVDNFISTRRIFHTALLSAGAASDDDAGLSLNHENPENHTVISEGYPLEWAIIRLERYRPGIVQAHGYDKLVRSVYANESKLVVNGERFELYAVRTDPNELSDLSQQNTSEIAAMSHRLQKIVQQMGPAAHGLKQEEDDEAVLEHLRILGYLE